MSAASERSPSARLVARQVSELSLARMRRWLELVPEDRLSVFVFDVVLSAGMAHQPFRDERTKRWLGVEDAEHLARPVNALAVAQSMGLPHTTVRRHAARLVAHGRLQRSQAGFMVSPPFFAEGPLARVTGENARALVRVLNVLANAGYEPAARAVEAGVTAVPPGVVERLFLAFSVRALETFTACYGDVVSGTLMSAIVAANIRHITDDPQLSRLYAGEDSPPPDEERRPITLRALSRALDLPFETVRRRTDALIERGMVERRDAGVVTPTRVLQADWNIENNRLIIAQFKVMLNILAALASGVRTEAPT